MTKPPEFYLLGIVLLLALLQIFLAAHFKTRQYGYKWNVGTRDETLPPPSPMAGRLSRAQANLFETLPLFIGALLANLYLGHNGYYSEITAELYVGSRLIYLPLYAFGVPYLRSIIWIAGIIGLIGQIILIFC
ncbi:MAG: MAPEG family protein [Zymomonas mobilis]|uniref:Putative MAPEG superfamily protein n=1 Tax=Zymomonas mobilis TaxID=542 RepID=A0A542W070_ZYMMB|nr:MAPEG family protein [Zymomonas mobilis]TQL16923.1 putative MAPEG superfamily protein [Zymomonas mobilis]